MFPHKMIEPALHCSKWQNNEGLAAFRWKLKLLLHRPSERFQDNAESSYEAPLAPWLVWA